LHTDNSHTVGYVGAHYEFEAGNVAKKCQKPKSRHFSFAKAMAFCVAKLRNFIGKYQRFGRTPCPHVDASSLKMQSSDSCETLATLSIDQTNLCISGGP